jgi:hypothetical protein
MTKKELVALLEDIRDDIEVIVDSDSGYLPLKGIFIRKADVHGSSELRPEALVLYVE